jgi:beta-glucosidase
MAAFPFQDPGRPLEERVRDLVSRMTLEEKVSQLVYQAKAVPRLGIPEYGWWNECLHGVGRNGIATVFPQAIGMAASFDTTLVQLVATVISDEARVKHHEAARQGYRRQYQGLTFWTPNVNIFRDPRWGRGQETYGEDPHLTGRMGVAFVKGLQGDDPRYLKLVATPKHYAVHSGPEALRHHFDARVGFSAGCCAASGASTGSWCPTAARSLISTHTTPSPRRRSSPQRSPCARAATWSADGSIPRWSRPCARG